MESAAERICGLLVRQSATDRATRSRGLPHDLLRQQIQRPRFHFASNTTQQQTPIRQAPQDRFRAAYRPFRIAEIFCRASAQGTGFTLPESKSWMRRADFLFPLLPPPTAPGFIKAFQEGASERRACPGRQCQRLFQKFGEFFSHSRILPPKTVATNISSLPRHANRNSFVRSSLIVSRSLAAFSNSKRLAASRISLSNSPM